MRTYPRGSRFQPTELGLVKLHLKNKVEKNISGFIKTLNVYGDAPWLLHHDTNPLYSRNEWYYFVPRKIRGVRSVSRMVPSNGDSLGGTWKSVGKKKDIKKNDKELMGYKTELVFKKNVAGELEKEKTDWHMDEYSLHRNGDEFHDLVLCHVRLLHSDETFKPHVPAAHQVDHVKKDNNNNNDVVLPNQEQQEAGSAMQGYEGGNVNQPQQQPEEQEDYILVDRHLRSNHNQRQNLLEDVVYPNGRGDFNQHQQQQQDQEDSLNLLHPPFQTNVNQEHYPLGDIAYHNAEGDMTGYGLMPSFNQGNDVNQQQDSPDPLLLPPLQQSNDNQEPHPLDDIAFDDNLTIDIDELLKILDEGKEQEDPPTLPLPPPLPSNVNQAPCLSWDTNFAPSQVENNYNNNTVLPNQEQREGGFANHYDMTMMVEKEHGDIKQQYQQELQQIDRQSLFYDPEWDDLRFSSDLIMPNMDVSLTQQQLRELEEERLQLVQPVPQGQDSGVHAAQVMPPPPPQSNNNHGQRPLVPSQVESYNNNTVLPNQEQREGGFANHYDMTMMVEKEHGDVKQDQEQRIKDLLSYLLSDDFGFDGPEDGPIAPELLKLLEPVPQAQDSEVMPPPPQSNDNHGQLPLVPSQVENHNNTNVLPKQEQQEAGFAYQNDMTMVANEHGDVKQPQDQEQQHIDLQSLLRDPEWDDLRCDFGGPEVGLILQNMEVSMTQQEEQEVQEEILKRMLEPVPQPQDSGVHADQVMPKD
uniref:NAC domain-containing protein n=1 Tax=Brassica campestris TaxID=3711 RepID=M4EX70_BRACM